MGQSQSTWSFPDCRAFMDKAVEAEEGWQVTFASRGKAVSFSQRCYTARNREVKRNIKVYTDPNHPLHNSSVWSRLTFIVKRADGRVLCEACGKEVEHWQVVAAQGDQSLDARCVSNGPL